jgi:hypothetical protein
VLRDIRAITTKNCSKIEQAAAPLFREIMAHSDKSDSVNIDRAKGPNIECATLRCGRVSPSLNASGDAAMPSDGDLSAY